MVKYFKCLTGSHRLFSVRDPLKKWFGLPLCYSTLSFPPSAVLVLYPSEVLS